MLEEESDAVAWEVRGEGRGEREGKKKLTEYVFKIVCTSKQEHDNVCLKLRGRRINPVEVPISENGIHQISGLTWVRLKILSPLNITC
jgi:hypothetical protein